jgi:hypothetical protein
MVNNARAREKYEKNNIMKWKKKKQERKLSKKLKMKWKN